MSFTSYASYFMEGLTFLWKLVGQNDQSPRDLGLEANVAALMDDFYVEQVGKANPPFYGVFDSCQPVAGRRVMQSPYCKNVIGDLEQPHLLYGLKAKIKSVKLLQLRLGTIECFDSVVYNKIGTVFKIRSRITSFGTNEDGTIVRIDGTTSGVTARYYGFYHEILETKTPTEYGMLPHPLVTDLYLKAHSQNFSEEFVTRCREEMGAKVGWGKSCTVNCFLASLPSLKLIDKDNNSTFEHPPPILTKEDTAKIILSLKSRQWFRLPGRDDSVLKCRYYPYRLDFHGNMLPSECDGPFLIAQCIRPILSVCLFCGEGGDGKFSSASFLDTMTKSDLIEQKSTYQVNKFKKKGSKALQVHVVACSQAALGKQKKDLEEDAPQKNRTVKKCYGCSKRFRSHKAWHAHCKGRSCIQEYFDSILSALAKKRKRHA